ncbi:MAG TPA: PadR family transcriptional regulator [Hyphomonas sp.]|nr:PadR family transcriptional regulator [Hyphomonas sp.]HRX72859.1 PadR family transcriptional regulator [Hyphomonas sp.]
MASKNEIDRKGMTELEACVLSLISLEGPCTAYSIRKQFEESLTSTWHASTGSIYPLIRRLTERDLLSHQDVESDGRGAKEIEATPAGRKAAQAWLKAVPDWVGEPAADPIRTRLNFIRLLAPGDRVPVVEKMMAATKASLSRVETNRDELAAEGRDFDALTIAGAQHMLRARLDWLEEVRAYYAGP